MRPIFQAGTRESLPVAIMLFPSSGDTAGKNAFSSHLRLDNLCQVGGQEMQLEGLGSCTPGSRPSVANIGHRPMVDLGMARH